MEAVGYNLYNIYMNMVPLGKQKSEICEQNEGFSETIDFLRFFLGDSIQSATKHIYEKT